MLVWMGKQLLGQKDKIDVGSDPDRPIKAEMTFKVQLVKSVHAEGDKPTVS